jgi:hypothetical protein
MIFTFHFNLSPEFIHSSYFMLNVEFFVILYYGAWGVACTFQYRPRIGSNKLSLHYFKFCRLSTTYYDSLFLYFEANV